MKYYFIAGENSGDLHGASLMKEIERSDSTAEFRYYGGDRMQEQGGELVKHYGEMAFMGFIEVLSNLQQIRKNINFCKQDIEKWMPDALILIDFPGFNLRIAEFAKAKNIMVFYYISPKIWAWNESRIQTIKKYVDHLFVIFPFEVEYFKKWDYRVDYVGNPLWDTIENYQKKKPKILSENKKNIIAVLPGSRKQEIERIFPEMVKAMELLPTEKFVVAGVTAFSEKFYRQWLKNKDVEIVFDSTYHLLSNAKAAIVTSGTATLETALFEVPQVVCYKGAPISIFIARMLIKIKFISLVNLIVDKVVVKELIQEKCTAQAIASEIKSLIGDSDYRNRMTENYLKLKNILSKRGASANTAALIKKYLTEN